jgi:hypothetical protein
MSGCGSLHAVGKRILPTRVDGVVESCHDSGPVGVIRRLLVGILWQEVRELWVKPCWTKVSRCYDLIDVCLGNA